MKTKIILTHALAFTALLLPAVVSAHCDAANSDGGCGAGAHLDADGHAVGASALLKAGDLRWFGIMAVAVILMSALSYGVYRYIQVAPIEKKSAEKK